MGIEREAETRLEGGWVTSGIVRVGETVRRPGHGGQLLVAPRDRSAVRRHVAFDVREDLVLLVIDAEEAGAGLEARLLETVEQLVRELAVRATGGPNLAG